MFLSISEFLRYLLLGLVQGITEPLPISSSGHLIIFKNIFNVHMEDDINFNIIVNFASFIAIVFYYRNFLKEIITGAWQYVFKRNKDKKNDFLYIVYVAIATVPAGIAGIFLKDIIDDNLSTLLSVGICLFITGLLLLFIHTMSKKTNKEEITLSTSIYMGIAQVIGLVPGISRSGVTTSAGVLNKTTVEKALRFSFMMYLPVSIGSMILGVMDLDTSTIYIPGYIIAFITSLLGTYFALKLFFKLVKKDNLKYFGYYCLTISMIILLYLAITK